MNMKVHQTLVWLNLLSFRTKDLAAPTIGIQSGLSWVGYHTPGCVQVLVSGAEDLATTACSTFPYTISCKSLHLPQNVHQQQTGLLRHFVSNTQACPLSSCNWALSCNQLQITTHCSVILTLSHQRTHCPSCNCDTAWECENWEDLRICSMPAGPVRQGKQGGPVQEGSRCRSVLGGGVAPVLPGGRSHC